jgi:TldD protein
MSFSEFLSSRRCAAKALIAELMKTYDYVSILGVDVKARSISVNNKLTNISSGMDTECGFVIRVAGDGVFYEYSMDDLSGDLDAVAAEIRRCFRFSQALNAKPIGVCNLSDEPLVRSFSRPSDLDQHSDQELLDYCRALRDSINARSENLLNVNVGLYTTETSKLFLSPNRELDQNYT